MSAPNHSSLRVGNVALVSMSAYDTFVFAMSKSSPTCKLRLIF